MRTASLRSPGKAGPIGRHGKDSYFPSDDGTLKTSQTTLGVGVLYRFNGKI